MPMSAPSSAPTADDTNATEPRLPDYAGGCIANLVPRIVTGTATSPDGADWIPEVAEHARQIVLLVVDGLGWEQLRAHADLVPTLAGADGAEKAITSVAPTTTACALTSITTGCPPAQHGLIGYRLSAPGDEIMNVLKWTLGTGTGRDARRLVPAADYQPLGPFPGASHRVPVVSKGEFGGTGFTAAHLGDSPLHDYRVPSSLAVEVAARLGAGDPFVYAYYDGIDKVAHAHGFGAHYDAELVAVDKVVADVVGVLPPEAVLLVTADHGQIEVGPRVELLGADAMDMVEFLSGEGRFRWLHARPGATDDLLALCAERYGDTTWVRTRDRLEGDGWFGGPLGDGFAARLGDVALIPFAPIAFVDPADTGENRLACRHGSLTTDEMLVPLVALRGG